MNGDSQVLLTAGPSGSIRRADVAQAAEKVTTISDVNMHVAGKMKQ